MPIASQWEGECPHETVPAAKRKLSLLAENQKLIRKMAKLEKTVANN
jgi:hypothetical protein